jgi:hypothetical protein
VVWPGAFNKSSKEKQPGSDFINQKLAIAIP